MIPLLAIAFIVFTIYKNVHGALAPYSHFPWFVLAWLAVGALMVALAPGGAKRIGDALTSELGGGRRDGERQLRWVRAGVRPGALPLVRTPSVEFVGLTPMKSTLGESRGGRSRLP